MLNKSANLIKVLSNLSKYKLTGHFRRVDAASSVRDPRKDSSAVNTSGVRFETPFGILPILEVDGKVFCQSVAIARYLGNKFGFTGKTDLDKLQADMIVDCIVDLCNPLETIYEEQDETKKQEILNAYIPKLDKHLENLEKMLEGGNGFFIGDSITWVDCVWTGLLYYLYFMKFGPIIEKHPKVAAIKGRVESEPRIAEWIRKRPHAEF